MGKEVKRKTENKEEEVKWKRSENKKYDEFLKDIIYVYKLHGLSLGIEYINGNFVICPLDDVNCVWIQHALDAI